jgi:hypothetical protein
MGCIGFPEVVCSAAAIYTFWQNLSMQGSAFQEFRKWGDKGV